MAVVLIVVTFPRTGTKGLSNTEATRVFLVS